MVKGLIWKIYYDDHSSLSNKKMSIVLFWCGMVTLTLRACSHGGGGPQVGEVPHLPVVKKASFHMQYLQPRGAGVRFPNAFTR